MIESIKKGNAHIVNHVYISKQARIKKTYEYFQWNYNYYMLK